MASEKTSRLGRLADMSIPPGDEVYSPPAEDRCEVFPTQVALEVDQELQIVQWIYRGKIVHFSISQRTYCALCQAWHTIRRIDTAHGTVHEHQFRHGEDDSEQTYRTIPVADIPPNEAGYDLVTDQFEVQWNRMTETWEAYRRSWGQSI